MRVLRRWVCCWLAVVIAPAGFAQESATKSKPPSDHPTTEQHVVISYTHHRDFIELPKPKFSDNPFEADEERGDVARREARSAFEAVMLRTSKNPPRISKTTSVGTITLSKNSATLENAAIIMHLDFATKRIINVDKKTSTFRDRSMIADVEQRIRDLDARMEMRDKFKLAKIAETPYDQPDSEASPGITHDGTSHPTWKNQNGITYGSINNFVPASWSGPTGEIPADLVRCWRAFMVHATKMHPELLTRLLLEPMVPKTLTFELREEFVHQKHRIEFASINTSDQPSFRIAANWSRQLANDDELDELINRTRKTLDAGQMTTKAEMIEKIRTINHERKELDRWMGLNLVATHYGSVDHAIQAELIDPDNHEFDKLQSFEINDERAFDDLKKIERTGLVFECWLLNRIAFCYFIRGDEAEARKHLLLALKQFPFDGYAWHDLGWMEARAGRLQRAFACWDLLTRLRPESEQVKSVKQFQKNVVTRRPSFFVPQGDKP